MKEEVLKILLSNGEIAYNLTSYLNHFESLRKKEELYSILSEIYPIQDYVKRIGILAFLLSQNQIQQLEGIFADNSLQKELMSRPMVPIIAKIISELDVENLNEILYTHLVSLDKKDEKLCLLIVRNLLLTSSHWKLGIQYLNSIYKDLSKVDFIDILAFLKVKLDKKKWVELVRDIEYDIQMEDLINRRMSNYQN